MKPLLFQLHLYIFNYFKGFHVLQFKRFEVTLYFVTFIEHYMISITLFQ